MKKISVRSLKKFPKKIFHRINIINVKINLQKLPSKTPSAPLMQATIKPIVN